MFFQETLRSLYQSEHSQQAGIGVDAQVGTECNARLTTYSPSAPNDPSVGLFSVYPLEQNWARGDREVVCIATTKSGTTTGSIKGK